MKVRPIIPRLGVQYGAVGGLMLMLAFVIFHYLGIPGWSLITLIISVVVIGFFSFLPIKEFKKYHNDGELRFYHGMSIAFLSYVSMALVFTLLYLIFINVIEPSYLQDKLDFQRELVITQKDQWIDQFGEDSYNTRVEGLKEISAFDDVWSEFIKRVLIGFFLAPIFSIILRTHKPR